MENKKQIEPIEQLEIIKKDVYNEIKYEYWCSNSAYKIEIFLKIAERINSTKKKELKYWCNVMDEYRKQKKWITLNDFKYIKNE